MVTLFENLDWKVMAAIYSAALSTFVFFRSVNHGVKCRFSVDPSKVRKSVEVTVAAYGTRPIFVEEVIFLRRNGAKLSSTKVREFIQPYEVKEYSFTPDRVIVDDVGYVTVRANGRTRVAVRD